MPAKRIKLALQEALAILGETAVYVIILDMEDLGIKLKEGNFYSLAEIEAAVRKMFGEDATILIMAMLRKKLDESDQR